MSIKYELLKKLVVAACLKKRWLSSSTEELQENRRKQNAKNHIPALKDEAFVFSRIDVMGFPVSGLQKSSVFPAPRDVVFQKLQRLETLSG